MLEFFIAEEHAWKCEAAVDLLRRKKVSLTILAPQVMPVGVVPVTLVHVRELEPVGKFHGLVRHVLIGDLAKLGGTAPRWRSHSIFAVTHYDYGTLYGKVLGNFKKAFLHQLDGAIMAAERNQPQPKHEAA